MITDELSTGIIEAVKTKLPQKDNLANTLISIVSDIRVNILVR